MYFFIKKYISPLSKDIDKNKSENAFLKYSKKYSIYSIKIRDTN
ncbi:hypothetical protein [Borreliella bavariensis]|nr:hypothetical protein [Borreliella bavariensis]